MSINDTAVRFARAIQNELIKVRTDQMELGQQLTERINGVAERVKVLDSRVTLVDQKVDGLDKRVSVLDDKVDSLGLRVVALDGKVDALSCGFEAMRLTQNAMQDTQTEMLKILIDIQRQFGSAACN